MAYKQVRDADMTVGYVGGWCLKYVQDAFHTDHPYSDAMTAWRANYGGGNHTGVPPLGITVPVYFSLGNLAYGHVAIRLDDGWVASSTLDGAHAKPYYHKDLADLIAVYGKYNGGCTYQGWSEFVGTTRVVQYIADKVTATAAQVKQAYLDVLERPADAGGIATYITNGMSEGEVRADLIASQEYKDLQAHKASLAQAQADAQAQAEANAQAAKEARDLADAEAKAKADQEARDAIIAEQPTEVEPAVSDRQNQMTTLFDLLIRLLHKILSIFR